MNSSANRKLTDEFGKPLRKPRLAAGGAGSGGGDGRDAQPVCICGAGKLLSTTYGPSFHNIVATLFNQLPKLIRNVLPLGQVPICETHRWK